MFELIINYGTVISYILFTFDIIMQIVQVYKRKSSLDISIKGLIIRVVAGFLIISKFFLVGDIYLIFGQAIFMTVLAIYIFIVIYYRFSGKKT